MTTITRETAKEFAPHTFSAWSSDLGIRPGEFPRVLETTLGNGLSLLATSKKVRDGDLLWVTYRQLAGCVALRVYND